MNLDRRRLLAALAAVPAFSTLPRPALGAQDQAPEVALDEVFALAAPVGLGAALVSREGLLWSGVRGLRRYGQPAPITLNDRWHLGSNTKAMTAAIFGRLVRQGRARWGMPLTEAFPGLAIDPAWGGATLDDFMHHRAGATDASVMGRSWLMTARQDPRSLPEQRAAIVAQILASPPSGAPGEFAYGNANYVVVGAAIERIVGGSWEDAMQRELFGPLGLASAGFGPPPGDNAWGHRGAGEQRLPMDPAHPGADNPLALGPAGTAHMSLGDYGRFLGAMMGGRPDWLSREDLARLTTPPQGVEPAYAAGWGVREQPWGGLDGPAPVLGHDGSNTMWHCSVAAAPARGLAIVTVSNESAAGGGACQTLLQRLVPTATSA